MMRIAENSDLILSHDKLPVFKMDKVGRTAIVSFMKWFNNVERRLLKALPFIFGYGLTAVSKQFVLKG